MIQSTLSNLLGGLTPTEEKYAPSEIYYIGNAELLSTKRRVSVVGTRKPTDYGKIRARLVTEALIGQNITVVSGLAEGIDTIAHTTTIEKGGNTIAVLGTSLNNVYPKSNLDLYNKISKDHLVISQFPNGYPITKANFPIRNRTMALISDATIIVEATERSGTTHQGWEALRLGRPLFLMENIVKNISLSWPKKMLDYGAQVLTKQNLDEILEELPSLTSRGAVNEIFSF